MNKLYLVFCDPQHQINNTRPLCQHDQHQSTHNVHGHSFPDCIRPVHLLHRPVRRHRPCQRPPLYLYLHLPFGRLHAAVPEAHDPEPHYDVPIIMLVLWARFGPEHSDRGPVRASWRRAAVSLGRNRKVHPGPILGHGPLFSRCTTPAADSAQEM